MAATVSLNDFFYDEYIPKYAKIFKKQDTWQENERMFKARFSGLKDCPINQISRLNVDAWHKDIGSHRGIYMANRCLALLRHMLNMAVDWGLISSNPASHIRMYKETARDRFLQPSEISRFMDVLNASTNKKLKNFILLLLFSGQRKANILSLRWEYFNFHNNIMYLPDTKNNQSQQIPLTEQAIAVLKDIGIRESGWVFPSDASASGHLESPKRFWAELLAQSGIENLRMHDLRRTMGSYQAIIGSSLNVIGKSLGHKSLQSTTIYARLSLAPVRESMQKATDEIYKMLKK
ncbi:MAG: site-specific integrase [Prevotella sp.]|nr:site-specific integrase [Muribaculaceae bacterium]MCM1404749.1 site-specific integrase [Prevotella sp.]